MPSCSHVFRGVEWQTSTPKHILLYRALGWEPPVFAHLPLIMNADGTKLSKRQNHLHVVSLRERHYFPEAVLNFVTLIGGGFTDKEYSLQTIHGLSELVDMFEVSRIHSSSGRLEMERLNELNQNCLKQKLAGSEKGSLVRRCRDIVRQNLVGVDQRYLEDSVIFKYLAWGQDRIRNLNDFVQPEYLYLWRVPDKVAGLCCDSQVLAEIRTLFNASEAFASFNKELKTFCKKNSVKYPQAMTDLRILLTGEAEGPPVKEIVEILGLPEAKQRVSKVD